ncbi:MAG: helix-turn-helix domain-containing protein [Candidatus Kapaibacterium sp.]
MTFRKVIGDNIRCFRNRLGWSQEVLGSKCGISRDYIGRIERGEVNVGTQHIERISISLDMEPHLLLEEGYCFRLVSSREQVISGIDIPPGSFTD